MTVPDPTPESRKFTPPMERIRDEYVQMRADHFGFSDLYAAEFDRALAQRDARIKAEALREAAVRFDAIALGAWGGPASWMTSGSKVGALVSGILRQWAADEAGEKPDVCTDGHARWRPGRDR